MAGTFVEVSARDGSGSFRAYLAVPPSGRGPGIVVAQEIFGINEFVRATADRYAEEGYVVIAPDLFWRQEPGVELNAYTEAEWQKAFGFFQGFDMGKGVEDLAAAVDVLRARPEFAGKVGCVGFCLGGRLAYEVACSVPTVDVSVGYYGVGIEGALDKADGIRGKLVLHIAEKDAYCPPEAQQQIIAALKDRPNANVHVYPGVDHAFARPASPHFHKPSALLAHERSIAAFRQELGPHYDLSALWDMHCYHEFATRDVDATMATMVAEPYVNHIPTMTGGVGHDHLKRFYRHHFCHGNPPDTKLVPLSRTVGATQVVDEMLFCFTHTTEVDWMLPGVAPTGKYVEIPLVAIINFRGDKLYHEHIYWDQASVLVQVGLLNPEGLPVAGIETARKLVDESLPSNTLMKRWETSEGKPF